MRKYEVDSVTCPVVAINIHLDYLAVGCREGRKGWGFMSLSTAEVISRRDGNLELESNSLLFMNSSTGSFSSRKDHRQPSIMPYIYVFI